MKKLLLGLLVALLVVFLPINYAWAISNPDSIAFGTGTVPRYKIFSNVLETGDMLIAAAGEVRYAVEPTDYTANEAFLFELLNTAGNVTLASTPLEDYGNRPVGIYLSKTQVDGLSLVSGTAYGIRITGNPAVFPSSTGNTVTAFLVGGDYVDQSTSGNTTRSNHIRNFMIDVANDMEANDTPSTSYVATSQGLTYLSSAGGSLFLAGIPGLDTMCPVLFLYSVSPISGDTPTSTGSYAATINVTAQWGTNTAAALTNLGTYMGINQALAGSAMALFLGLFLAIIVYKRVQSGVATLMLMATYPFIMAWMGLMPLALAFVVMMMVVILGGFYFFRQGAL